ncbi:MAG: anti-sigma-factor antagonist [Pseudonocardia sp.]|jgi:anti-anti-sigma factor|nr:anti-sigma-factor antagonist [Pseudonocardia sp.]
MTDEPLMSAVTTRVGSAVLLTVKGEVDLHTAPELVDTVVAALHLPGGGTPDGDVVSAVVADLTGVVFLSSAGLGTLVALSTRLGEDKIALRLVGGENRAVTRPWTAMHLGDVLPLYPDLPSALDPVA